MIQTKLRIDPISTCNSPDPKMNASGTITSSVADCEETPDSVAIYQHQSNEGHINFSEIFHATKVKEEKWSIVFIALIRTQFSSFLTAVACYSLDIHKLHDPVFARTLFEVYMCSAKAHVML